MSPIEPMFAGEATAARLLDMKPKEFADLVARGFLPAPRDIGGLKRYDVDELRRVLRGDKIGAGAMTW